jgi:hypothetical protein
MSAARRRVLRCCWLFAATQIGRFGVFGADRLLRCFWFGRRCVGDDVGVDGHAELQFGGHLRAVGLWNEVDVGHLGAVAHLLDVDPHAPQPRFLLGRTGCARLH